MTSFTVSDIPLEFDHQRINSFLRNSSSRDEPFSLFLVDVNVLACSVYDKEYQKILLDSDVNSCDGSFLAMVASYFAGKTFRAYNGPDLFRTHINNSSCRQLILGSTPSTYQSLLRALGSAGYACEHLHHISLPFIDVGDFDYSSIANSVNEMSPDIVWVSLGAPKQEVFITMLLPYVHRGVFVASGAALDFYVQKIYHPRCEIGPLRFIWLSRLFANPSKQSWRLLNFFFVLPVVLFKTATQLK
jgi:N-acetylglucosaminyldiphosphoundecaprenol N-acetyl-beta-D-mannosaminyltransferase